jgi:hypothetical protein
MRCARSSRASRPASAQRCFAWRSWKPKRGFARTSRPAALHKSLALAEAEKAFALAAEAETKRFRGNAPEVRADAAAAAEILRRRARLIALAAKALAAGGRAHQLAASSTARPKLLAAIDAARLDGERRRALLLADGLVARAMRLLGDVRREPRVAPRGGEALPRRSGEGLRLLRWRRVPRGCASRPTAPSKAALARMATLIAAHPNGAVMILGRAQDFRAIEAQLQRGGVSHGPLTHVDGKDLAVVFAAYAAVP